MFRVVLHLSIICHPLHRNIQTTSYDLRTLHLTYTATQADSETCLQRRLARNADRDPQEALHLKAYFRYAWLGWGGVWAHRSTSKSAPKFITHVRHTYRHTCGAHVLTHMWGTCVDTRVRHTYRHTHMHQVYHIRETHIGQIYRHT